MQITMIKTSDIHPYERNPRNNDTAVDAVAKSIQEFGWRAPIVVDDAMVVVAGHTRLKAAIKLGLNEVPVHVASDLTPAQIQAYRIADNKTSEIAEWNYDLLPLELKDLQSDGFDLSLLGFDTTELDRLLSDVSDEIKEGQTEANEAPEVPEEVDSQPDKIYRLDHHRLMCGDSTKIDDVSQLMAGELATLYLTDPPYNVAFEGSNGLTIKNDHMQSDKFLKFLESAFSIAAGVLANGSSFYIFHSENESANFRLAIKNAGLEFHEALYWVKNSFVLGHLDYHYITEPCLYGWKPGAVHRWFSDRSQTNALYFDKPRCNDVHPTMKPVEMLIYLIRNSTTREDIVLDNFGGSGSTLIACEQVGRKCRMMELDPKYCDVIRRRWAEFVHGADCDWQALTPEA